MPLIPNLRPGSIHYCVGNACASCSGRSYSPSQTISHEVATSQLCAGSVVGFMCTTFLSWTLLLHVHACCNSGRWQTLWSGRAPVLVTVLYNPVRARPFWTSGSIDELFRQEMNLATRHCFSDSNLQMEWLSMPVASNGSLCGPTAVRPAWRLGRGTRCP